MSTRIFITPPGSITEEIKVYDRCQTRQSTTDKAGSFLLTLPSFEQTLMNKYPLGSDVRIIQGDNVFRGWILNPKPTRNGSRIVLQIEGLSYSGRIQKVLVTEDYTDKAISDIVADLFLKYAPEYNRDNLVVCAKVISIKFNDIFLFDAIEQLAGLASFEWYIDEPVPELLDTTAKSAGWQETVELSSWKVVYPSEDLCPSISLIPA